MRFATLILILLIFLSSSFATAAGTAPAPPQIAAAPTTNSEPLFEPDESAQESLARKLLALKAQRDAAASAHTPNDPQLSEIDQEILALRSQLAAQYHGNSGKSSEAESDAASPAYPRIVTPVSSGGDGVDVSDRDSAHALANPGTDSEDADPDSPNNILVRGNLRRTVTLSPNKVPLGTIVDTLSQQCHINFFVNWRALQTAGLDRNTPVSLNVRDVPAYRALHLTLETISEDTAHLGYTVYAGTVTVSTQEDLNSEKYQLVKIYDVRDLLSFQISRGADSSQNSNYTNRVNLLISSIMAAVASDSWRDNGGNIGSIHDFDGRLIVNQTADNHIALALLLAKLRAH